MEHTSAANRLLVTSRIPAPEQEAAAADGARWSAALQVGLIVSLLAAVFSVALQGAVSTTPLVLSVMVIAFTSSWVVTGRPLRH